MIINTLIHFFLDIAKEVLIVVFSTYILTLFNKKKKNHSTDQNRDGSSSD